LHTKRYSNIICHISTVHSVRDIRIFHKECKSLSNAGYLVHYVVSHNCKEKIDGIQIIPLPYTSSRFRRIFINTWVALHKALLTKSSLYHFHDPEFLPAGLVLRLLGKKVIYDAHEHLSKDILDKPWIKFAIFRRIISYCVGAFEQLSAKLMNGVVAATSHIADQFDPRKTVAVRNFPMLGFINNIPKPPPRKDGKRTIIYTGGLTRIRGIIPLIDAMEALPADVELVLAGQWEDTGFERECISRSGWSKCRYAGLVPQEEAYGLMKGADAGILTFLPVANHLEAMPNKAFEYLACGLPLVISDFPYWREVFGRSAVYVNPEKPESIAGGILVALESKSDTSTSREISISGELSWEAEERVLIDFYRKILYTN